MTVMYFDTVTTAETFWQSRRHFVEARGYLLNPLLQSQSVARLQTRRPLRVEYHASQKALDVIDATRLADGRRVVIKGVPTPSDELTTLASIHQGPSRTHPANHCVPILEVFEDTNDPELSYIAMPSLGRIRSSTFRNVGDVVHFTSQILLGLDFMHAHHVAHRDCSLKNIMVEQSESRAHGPPSLSALPLLRHPYGPATLGLPRYYFVNFSRSVSQDPTKDNSENPLANDIFLVGDMLRREFLTRYANVEFLQPLIECMICSTLSRTSASEALQEWHGILPQVSLFRRGNRLRGRHEWWIQSVVLDAVWLLFRVFRETRRALFNPISCL
ncbi:hypothetical protein BDW22DRAFT_884508 [Trametopsis cervina]|nr:hypothetical protein BDW22DRAFT_884508 [Trametopsis cervina]